jgi:dienelactone hydrolase
MDEKVGKLTPFKDLAEGLANRGIAVIRYDKRTYAHKKQFINKPDISVKEETIEDAILATELLRNDSRIDFDKIFIIGHSMGGMLAPRIDSEGGNYKGLILLAGSPRKLEEILIEQNEEVLKSVNKLLKWIINKQIKKLSAKFDIMYNLTDEEAKKTSLMFGNAAKLYYFKEMGEHSSINYLKDLNKPMLIMQGDKDFQVSVERDFNLYKEILKDKGDITFKLYENLNHAFVPSVYGNIMKARKEYNVEQHICDYVIDDIKDWVLAQ